jgi:hydrogenase-4 component F
MLLAGSAVASGPAVAFGGLVRVDGLGALLLVTVLLVSAVAVAASPRHLAADAIHRPSRPGDDGRYYALLSWFVAGLASVPLVDDLGLVWVAIEATTIVSALLIGFDRTPAAIEAAWKALILGSIGIGFALLATLLVYASSVPLLGETSDALAWSRLLAAAPGLDPALVRLAFVFALAGYGTKAGLAPFHTWLPDAHSQAPSPISGLLSGAALAVAIYALARFQAITASAIGPGFPSGLMVAAGILSLAVALPFLVAQGDLKRLLAYSSVEHMGVSVLALGFGGQLALAGFGLHLVCHGLAKAVAFVAAGRVVAERGSRRIGRLKGAVAGVTPDGPALLAGSLILTGLPPSGVFVAELGILWGGFKAGWGAAAAIAAVLMALSMAGFLFHLVRLGSGSPGPAARDGGEVHRWGRGLLVGAPLVAVVLLGVWAPGPFRQLLDALVLALRDGHG